MHPRQLSRELRMGCTPQLARRRAIVGLSLAVMGTVGFMAMYQFGLIRRLPGPKRGMFDAEKVDSSDEAYSLLWTGDAFLALTSYATTATLAAMGESDRARTRPWIPLAMTAKVLFDSAVAALLTWVQWARIRAFCWYCLLATALTFAMLPLTWGEARTAWRNLRNRPDRRLHRTPSTGPIATSVLARSR